jgi:hypothetical protein
MALPLLFFIGSSLIRAATPVIAKMLVKQGYKRASGAVVKNALKNSKKIRTIGSKKDIPIAKSKSLTIPKNQSTALTKINKTTGGNKSKLVNGKVVTAATTVASGATLLAKDDKKGQAKADTKKKVLPGRMEGGPPQRKGTTSTATAMTFGKAFRAAKDAGKKEFTYKGKKYHTRTKDEDKKTTSNQSLPKSRPNTEKKLDKKVEKKTPNYGGAQTIPKKEDKKKEEKKSKGFLDRVKDDLKKAVKETKRNFSDKRYFVNGVDSRKEKIKSKSNIKQKK